MTTPYEYVDRGEEFCEQNLGKATAQYRKAIELYQREHDTEGTAYALGRLGNCYEQHGQTEEAIAAYQKAVALETDIPAIYHQLVTLLVDSDDLTSAFEVADRWKRHGRQQTYGSPDRIFADLGNALARKNEFDAAINLLTQAVGRLEDDPDVEGYWMARGYLGHTHERAGRLEEATAVFSAAIDAGSTDRLTFTRYLMYLEKQKRFDDALRITIIGLRVQHNAAWELDLRKRQQRIEQKAGKTPRLNKEEIPVYSVRQGKASVALLHQVKSSPQINELVVADDVAFAISGGKNPKLTAYRMDDASIAWNITLPEAAQGVQSTQNAIVTYAVDGPVGAGKTILRFWSKDGVETATQELPAVTSEVCGIAGLVFAGCRDGMLYAFTDTGRILWTHRTPGSEGRFDNPYMRPCPYLVRVAQDVVVYSSFENLFCLNWGGQPRWRWSVAERVSSKSSGRITIQMSSGPSSISDIAVAHLTRTVLVAADQSIYEVHDGKTIHEIRKQGHHLGSVAVSADSQYWAYCAGDRLYTTHKRSSSRGLQSLENASLLLDSPANRVVAWIDRELLVADAQGKRVAHLEFAKRISNVFSLSDGRLVVGAGHLVILNTSAASLTPSNTLVKGPGTPKPPAAAATVDVSRLPKEENGFPIRWFVGRKVSSQGKARYEGAGGQLLTIEQLALQEYDRLGYRGSWTENEYWWAIMALLFWDVIFARLPGVFTPAFGDFPSQMQDMPIDFFSGEFFSRRRQLIEKRVDELTKSRIFGLRKPSLEQELRASFRQHFGKPCRPVDWQKWNDVDVLAVAVQTLSEAQVMQIMQRLLINFNDNRRGLPDLFLARDGEALFSEVKSEREQLAEHQWAWMRFLRDHLKCAVEVCRIASS